MEKNNDLSHKKKKKLIIASITIFLSILSVFILVGCLYTIPLASKYSVEYINDNSNMITQTYYKGDKIFFPKDPIKDGYNFIGWSLNRDGEKEIIKSPYSDIIVDKELTLYAVWEKKNFNLKIDNNNYIIDYGCEFNVLNNKLSFIDSKNNLIEINAFSKDGFTFAGWTLFDGKNSISLNSVDYSEIKSKNLEIKSSYISHLINFTYLKSDKYDLLNFSHKNNIYTDEILTFDLKLNQKYNRSNVQVCINNGNVNLIKLNDYYRVEISNFISDFDIEIKNIKINTYQIKYLDEISNKVLHTQDYDYGSNLILPDSIIKEGYSLIGFKDNNGKIYTGGEEIYNDVTLIPIWEIKTFNVCFPNSDGKFAINYNNQYITSQKQIKMKYGSRVDFKIVLSEAYDKSNIDILATINNSEITLKNENLQFSLDVLGDVNIDVLGININQYEIIVDDYSYGYVSHGSNLVLGSNNTIIINDIYNNNILNINKVFEDENFAGWFVGESVLMNSNINDNLVINGKYSKNWNRVVFDVNGGNSNGANSIILVDGEILECPNPTKDGYQFAGWFVYIVETNKVVDLNQSTKFDGTITNNMILYAGWKK